MNKPNDKQADAATGPVDRQVRPVAWYDASDFTRTSSTQTAKECDPLYDHAALDAAVAAERGRWEAAVAEVWKMVNVAGSWRSYDEGIVAALSKLRAKRFEA